MNRFGRMGLTFFVFSPASETGFAQGRVRYAAIEIAG